MSEWTSRLIKAKKIGFLGAGNLSKAIIKGLEDSSIVELKNIYVSNRNSEKKKILEKDFSEIQVCSSNEDLMEKAGIIVLGVKPQDLSAAIEPIRHTIREDHIIISLAAGVPIKALKDLIPQTKNIIRWMPNTAIRIQKSVIGYSVEDNKEYLVQLSEALLKPLGLAIQVDEGDELNSLMVACASGPAFIYEFMQIWQSWLESYGFPEEVSQKLSLQTFIGSVLLAEKDQNLNLSDLQNQITSKKGVTEAGLKYFRQFDFENILNSSFEKAIQRAKDIEEEFEKEVN